MGIFDFDNNTVCGENKVKDECLIAFKVYDSCRQQTCLDNGIVGPARAACNACYCGITVSEGEIITPPSNAASVTISDLQVERVVIVSKTPSNFKLGYWDIDLKYVFSYTLTFRDINGDVLCSVHAQSVYNKMITLFGSTTTNSAISTDLLASSGTTIDLNSDPFVWVESKAVALKAELNYDNCCCGGVNGEDADSVFVTIGLFSIVKLYRIVNLTVCSKGFCIPGECEPTSTNPCDFFEDLDFPMDVFAPPQKPEFVAGISNNIPAEDKDDDDCCCKPPKHECGCGCGCNRR
jgi:predicted membrane protein